MLGVECDKPMFLFLVVIELAKKYLKEFGRLRADSLFCRDIAFAGVVLMANQPAWGVLSLSIHLLYHQHSCRAQAVAVSLDFVGGSYHAAK